MAAPHQGVGGDEEFVEPPHLKRLRWMVMLLIFVLIFGVLAIAATIVIRLGFGADGQGAAPMPQAVIADRFILPGDAEIEAIGSGSGTALFVLKDAEGRETLIVFDARTGQELSRSAIERR